VGRWVWVDSLLQNTGSNSASPWHGRLLLSAGRPRLAFWDILSDLDDGVGNEPVIFTRQPPGQRRRRSAALLAPLPNVPSATLHSRREEVAWVCGVRGRVWFCFDFCARGAMLSQ